MNDDTGYNGYTTNQPRALLPREESSSSLGRLLLLGLVVGAAVVMVKQMPDLRRYLKMRQM